MTRSPAGDQPPRTFARFWPLALLAVTLIAYWPATRAGWVWDDDYYVTRNATLRSSDGLRRIWFEIGAVPQYYPLTHTSFWIEWRLWGDRATGYHVTNILLHAANAILVGVILRRLAVPGWWLVPWLFALHPVHVESVAWITERKNVLSGLFYLLSFLAYLRWESRQPSPAKKGSVPIMAMQKMGTGKKMGTDPFVARCYWVSLALFGCALLSKSVTASLPAVVLLIVYWRRGNIAWQDVRPLLPFFALGIAMGALTGWMEREVVGAKGPEFAMTFIERLLVAGRAVWFYAAKLLWPHPLMFMYPRWQIDPGRVWQFAFPLAAAGLVVALWMLRRRVGRAPIVAVLFFGGTLVPALGFVNVLPMRYSFVADHFQYLASLGLLTLLAAGVVTYARRAASVMTLALCVVLAVLTWRHTHDFIDLETLWRSTLAKNPSSWMAENNLGILLYERRDYDAAAERFGRAIALKPDHDQSRLNLGMIAERRGQLDQARGWYLDALRVKPGFANAHYNLARLAASQGGADEAIEQYRLAIAHDPKHDEAMTNLGVIYAERGDGERAATLYRRALEVNPSSAAAHVNLGNLHLGAGRIDDALAEWAQAARLQPRNPVVPNNIGVVLLAQGNLDDAERRFRQALAIRPEYVEALINLGTVRARRGDIAGARQFLGKALSIDPGNAKARKHLDALNAG